VPSKENIPMSSQEKAVLGQNIRQLPPQYLADIWNIVSDESHQKYQKEIEFNIDNLSIKKARKLEAYVESVLSKLRLEKINRERQIKRSAGQQVALLFDYDSAELA